MEMPLLVILPLATFAIVMVAVLWSRSATRKRKEEEAASKSTLARDKDSHGKPADVE
ncbi:hypothetical protein [Roseovarius aquimarinus]|uniref:Uncharacterized protein n=1 Tax=Roseovarius aquimarinus TaxID=1229156 RepID=A0ABW7I9X9_9RHOB